MTVFFIKKINHELLKKIKEIEILMGIFVIKKLNSRNGCFLFRLSRDLWFEIVKMNEKEPSSENDTTTFYLCKTNT